MNLSYLNARKLSGKLLLLLITIATACQSPMPTNWSLTDPVSDFTLDLSLDESGQLFYTLKSGAGELVGSSRLGAVRSDTDLSQGLSFVSASEAVAIDQKHEFLTGKELITEERGVSRSFLFRNEAGAEIEIQCRLYTDGVAIRYVFPGQTDELVTLLKDVMEYRFDPTTKAWLQPYDRISMYTPAYERFLENGVTVGDTSSYGNGWAYPALFNVGDQWVLLSESAVMSENAGSHLDNTQGSSTYFLRWAEPDEAMGAGAREPSSTLPWQTSWKTFIVGDLSDIVASNMVRHLAPESRIADVSWIKPGRASWSWLSDHDSPQDKEKLKKFIDLASEMGWEYSLVDANWNLMPQGTIEELVAYGKERGVGILLWYNSGGPHNEVTEQPKDRMLSRERRREEMAWMRDLGVKGMKVDFFQSDKQHIIRQYIGILEDAADFQLHVNFHGCTIPRGWSRTYPNLMTMESVRGAESYTFDPLYPENAPALNTIIPFTRNVIGSVDYTPIVMTDMQYPHITTNAHEMATGWLFESGWQHPADAVEGFRALPDLAKELLKSLPTTWDNIEYVAGYPGKDVILARRKGATWYVAGINGENEAKSWEVDLSFAEVDCSVISLTDGEGPRDMNLEETTWSGEKVSIDVAAYGGFLLKMDQLED